VAGSAGLAALFGHLGARIQLRGSDAVVPDLRHSYRDLRQEVGLVLAATESLARQIDGLSPASGRVAQRFADWMAQNDQVDGQHASELEQSLDRLDAIESRLTALAQRLDALGAQGREALADHDLIALSDREKT
jgi:hypothetical protein